MFSRLGRKYYTSFEDGLEEARREGIEYVREMARRAGADDVAIEEFCDSKKVSVGEEIQAPIQILMRSRSSTSL